MLLGPSLISWRAKNEPTVSRSSTEEYRSLAFALAERSWIPDFLCEIGLFLARPVSLYYENVSTTYLAVNPLFHARRKHIGILRLTF